MNKILLNVPKTLSDVNHDAPELLESDYDANTLYSVGNMSLDYTIEHNYQLKRALEYKSSYVIENRKLNDIYTW